MVFDAVGLYKKSTCKKVLKSDGTYASVMGSAKNTDKALEFVVELIEKGHIKAIIDTTFEWDEIVKAHQYVDIVEIKDVSEEHKDQHPGKIVFSFTVTAGNKSITNFGKGTATISLPYELKSGEKAEDVNVWYLTKDGTMSEVPCSYDPTAKLATFKVNHFSLYVVGTAKTGSWVNPYSDIKASNWFYDAVRYVSANNLMQGTKDTAFSPNAKTTRGMIVTILWRMENSPKATKGTTFADVKNGKYYYDAVVWASEKGIVGGYSAEHFASPAFYGKRCKVNINLSEV